MEKFTRDFVTKHIENWTKWLGKFAGVPCQGLEIGSYEGRSALWFCNNILTHYNASLVCVDIHVGQKKRNAFLKNTEKLRDSKKIHYFQKRSGEFLPTCNEEFDFIYVDGNHKAKFVLSDAVLSWSLLKKGGILIFDDYGGYEDVKKAVDAFLDCFSEEIQLIGKGYQVAVSKK